MRYCGVLLVVFLFISTATTSATSFPDLHLPGPLAVPGQAETDPPLLTQATFPQQVLELVNQARWDNGQLPPLKGNLLLTNAAQDHSYNMAVRDFFAHCDLDTQLTPGQRMTAAGYHWNSAAENIAAGYSSPTAVMNGWMNSSGHRANILSTTRREIGIGYYHQADDQATVRRDAGGCNPDGGGHGPYYRYWTQKFGLINNVMPVVINREAFETNSPQVELYMYGEGWATEMRFRNENDPWSDWMPYQPTSDWQLSDGNELKTVHAEIRNGNGTVRSASDDIWLNSPAPQPANLALSSNAFSFILHTDGPLSQDHTLIINNSGDEPLSWQINPNEIVDWLAYDPASGDLNGDENSTVTITASRNGLTPGLYQMTLVVDAGAAQNSPQTITITLIVTEQSPLFLPLIIK